MKTLNRPITGTTTFTIKGLPQEVKDRLRVQAARRGRSMMEEARQLLTKGTEEADAPRLSVVDALQEIGELLGDREIPIPSRKQDKRELPDFSA